MNGRFIKETMPRAHKLNKNMFNLISNEEEADSS